MARKVQILEIPVPTDLSPSHKTNKYSIFVKLERSAKLALLEVIV